jgi:proteasome lid subunit RPN8/RPN11
MIETLVLAPEPLAAIVAHGEQAYPNEACGFLLGHSAPGGRTVVAALPLENAREAEAQPRRFLITPDDVQQAEDEAAARGLEVVGVYHSHPDHPAEPSTFDREHSLPWWSYVITRIDGGRGAETRAWRLADDRSRYWEDTIVAGLQATLDDRA